MLVKRSLLGAALDSGDISTTLTHLDSAFCWCDPMVEVDEDGQEVVVHKEVTWN